MRRALIPPVQRKGKMGKGAVPNRNVSKGSKGKVKAKSSLK